MRLNGARAICQALVEEGVSTIFGLPGGAIMPLYDVLPEFPQLRHILVRHEQCAGHMADGYARAAAALKRPQEERVVGVCFGTSGPGATNLVTGICNAHMDSVPIVAITANVPTSMIGTDAFQEADITGITIPITKQNYFVRSARDVPRVIKEAFHLARTGRPGPVHVDVPKDVLLTELEWNYPASVDLPGYQPTLEPNMRQVKEAARLIERAQRPVIIAGQGVLLSGAWDALREFAEKTNVPVMTTLLGISGFPESHPLSLGFLGMHGWVHCNYAVHHSDLVVAIGMRMDDRACGKFAAFAPQAKIVHIDIDPAEIGKNVRVDVPIVGDVGRVLAKLTPEIETTAPDRSAWLNQIQGWRSQYPPKHYPDDTPELYQPQVLQALYRATRGQAIIVADVGQHQMFAAQHYRYDEPYSYLTSGGLGTMGYSLPAAIGAQMARPDKQVWCVVGDGCFQMTLQELAVAAGQRIPIKIALLNNEYLGMVRQQQQVQYRGNIVEVDLATGAPDYVKLAQAYGIPAWRVSRPGQDLNDAIGAAMAYPGPAIVECRVAREEDVYPWVLGGTALGDVLPDTPYQTPERERQLAAAGPSPKDATDR